MTHSANKPIPKLRKAPQPPLSHAGATPDSDRAKRPALSEPSVTGQELTRGDRVEGLGNFGKPTGEIGTVERANEEDAVAQDSTNRRSKRFRLPRSRPGCWCNRENMTVTARNQSDQRRTYRYLY
jgi:hypothetical protein